MSLRKMIALLLLGLFGFTTLNGCQGPEPTKQAPSRPSSKTT